MTSKDFEDIIDKRGTLSNIQARMWYKVQNSKIPEKIDNSLPLEERAMQAYNLRVENRNHARELMKDELMRKQLDEEEKSKPFETLLRDKMERKNMTREQALQDIIDTAPKSRKSVDDKWGL